MVSVIVWGLGALIILTSVLSAYFSIRSRRSADGRLRGLYAARMNISMGAMLFLIAFVQMFMFPGSIVRVIVGAVFMLLGLFNLFSGFRNHSYFSKRG